MAGKRNLTKVMSLKVSDHLIEELKEAAEFKQDSVSGFIRYAIWDAIYRAREDKKRKAAKLAQAQ